METGYSPLYVSFLLTHDSLYSGSFSFIGCTCLTAPGVLFSSPLSQSRVLIYDVFLDHINTCVFLLYRPSMFAFLFLLFPL